MPRAPRRSERTETVRAIVDDELRRAAVLTTGLHDAHTNLTTALARAKSAGCTWDELSRVTGFDKSTLRHWLNQPRRVRPTTVLAAGVPDVVAV